MKRPRILLLNPAIYDFSAYDFWLKPYGMLRVAGFLRDQADLRMFDYLDRLHPEVPQDRRYRLDKWGRGEFHSEPLPRPAVLDDIPRHYHRFGLPRRVFHEFLKREAPFDVVLIQTVMTYWYPGVREAIEDVRALCPGAKIVLGGVYATLCPQHAASLGVDLIVDGLNLDPLWKFVGLAPDVSKLPFWDDYATLNTGVLKLADGCPFKCTYCSVPQVYPTFQSRPLERSLAEFDFLCERGVENIAFYDDALLFQPERILIPFLQEVMKRDRKIQFSTPNALNARFISKELVELMVAAGFKIFYLGFESNAYEWQKKTGGKVYSHELEQAITNLEQAGADINQISAYLILAHPQADQQNVEASMRFASSLGIRVMLSEFSPIPGTPDGEFCRQWINLDEPLNHSKTSFPIRHLGLEEVNRMKSLSKELNQDVQQKRIVVDPTKV